jgi:ubiquinone/menaquinone biosynthesis C-methylase UbiE
MAPPGATEAIRAANRRYHDLAARRYDQKWGIDYGERGGAQVLGKLAKALGGAPGHFERGLEIGAGTGYFGLNLLRAGTIGAYVATDISPGMLAVLGASARELGLPVEIACCESTRLPFSDDSFDLVFGHAVLHHLVELDASLRELRRVLRPGGTIVFCGEPSHHGDRLAAVPKRAAHALAPAWRTLVRAPAAAHDGYHAVPEEARLEGVVDVHTFTPALLERHLARAGFEGVRVRGEELAASLFGWSNRALEATAEPSRVPRLWHLYAYHGYRALAALDRALLEPRLPPALFYNLLVSARAPAAAQRRARSSIGPAPRQEPHASSARPTAAVSTTSATSSVPARSASGAAGAPGR